MIYLILLLLISHGVVLYLLKKYIEAYKTNNHNYINKELRALDYAFSQSVKTIGNHIDDFSSTTEHTFERLEQSQSRFNENSRERVGQLTSFIKSDYRSLTELVKTNNDLLSKLLDKTKINITKNEELKHILQNSNEELEKIYSKIKLLTSSYEKSLKDIQTEVEDVFVSIENTATDKVKQLAAGSEKTLVDALEICENTVQGMVETTNQQLSILLKENQIAELTQKIQAMENGLTQGFNHLNGSLVELDKSFMEKLNAKNNGNDKKGFLGF